MKRSMRTTATATILGSSSYILRDIHFSLPNVRELFKKFPFRKVQSDAGTPMESLFSKHNKKLKKILPIVLVLVGAGAIIFVTGRILQSSTHAGTQDQRAQISGPRATQTLNKDFLFSIFDDKGKEVTKLKYTVESAEIRDEIIVKGTRAVAIKGRTFLILNLKLVNSYDKGINITARDYIRLVVNGNTNEQVAADIHNDPVNVQAISTKSTRLGYPINETDIQNLSLQVGEIKGNKETVALKF